MPQLKAAKKYIRKTKKRTKRNILAKRRLKEIVKKADKLLDEGKADTVADILKKAQQALDKAVKRHIIHANKANRTKQRLARKVKAKK